jgi:hypothetical protein
MFSLFKQGRKVALNFLSFLIVYAVFIPLVFTVAGENAGIWMPFYSFLVGLFLSFVTWGDVYEQAMREKRAIYDLHPSPHKGIFIGLVGISPFVVLTIAAFIFTNLMSEKLNFTVQLISIINNAFLSPVFFIISLLGNGIPAYIAAVLFIPFICWLAYLFGNRGITRKNLMAAIKSKKTIK